MDELKLKLAKNHSENLDEIKVSRVAFSYGRTFERHGMDELAIKYYKKAEELAADQTDINIARRAAHFLILRRPQA